MSQTHQDPRARLPRYTLRHLGVILAAYAVYGVLLLGTSAIIANPEQVQAELNLQPFADLLADVWQSDLGAWLPASASLGDTAD